jgi:hypothetical protein
MRAENVPECPEALSSVAPYLHRSDELLGVNALAAHCLRRMAMTLSLKKAGDAGAQNFLYVLMDTLEEENKVSTAQPMRILSFLLLPAPRRVVSLSRWFTVSSLRRAPSCPISTHPSFLTLL